jgi:4-amino-4-deoxy-L-arabinose transferase-like glycosyltransferase
VNDAATNSVSTLETLPVSAGTGTATQTRERLGWCALTGAYLFSMLWGIRTFGIQDNNEGLYAEVAREMNLRHDWVVPHLNGAPYLEKPPLLYWMEAMLLRIFGNHDWAVRLGPVLCFAGTIGAVVWIGHQLRSPALGRKAALLLCSAAGIVGMSRSLLFDGPLTCALTWAFGCFLGWRLAGSRRTLRGMYVALAIGVMAKGLITLVLAGGTIVISTLLARRSRRDLMALWDLRGAMLFALIVVPWHVLAAWREPGFAEFYFINEHVRRFLGTREPHDFYTGPAYYYLLRLPLYLGVWFFALPALNGRKYAHRGSPAYREVHRVLFVAAALAFTFFSFSEGKANYYLLCIMPAFCLLIALHWPEDGIRRKRLYLGSAGIAVIAVTFASAPMVFSHHRKLAPLVNGQQAVLGTAAIALLGLAATIAWLTTRRRNQAVFWCMTAAGLVMLLPLPALLERADPLLSQRAAAAFLSPHNDEPVVLYRAYEDISSFVYYFGRPIPIVDSESNELLYAFRRYPGSPAFIARHDLHALSREKQVWLVAKTGHLDEVLKEFAADAPRVVQRFPRTTIIVIGPQQVARIPALTSRRAPQNQAPAQPTVSFPISQRL